jgi:type VI secretion system VasD/TssJ family lipoprotein
MSKTKCENRPLLFIAGLIMEAILAFLLTSCSSSGPIYVSLYGNEKMNVENEKTNESHAVLVCLYMLRSETNFMRVPLETFWQEGEKAFASDLVGIREEKILIPNDTQWVPLHLTKEVNFIGAAADFRRPDKKGWRLVYSLADKKPKEIWLTVGKDKIEIERIK